MRVLSHLARLFLRRWPERVGELVLLSNLTELTVGTTCSFESIGIGVTAVENLADLALPATVKRIDFGKSIVHGMADLRLHEGVEFIRLGPMPDLLDRTALSQWKTPTSLTTLILPSDFDTPLSE